MHKTPQIRCLLTPLAFIVFIAPAASGQVASSPGILSTDKREQPFRNWSEAKSVDPDGSLKVNTAVQDGCPIESPDGHHLYIASDRPGGKGGLDIWVSYRQSPNHPWGEPVNLPEPVNSASNDFCPTPLTGGRLLFVSNRASECGGGSDIFETRLHPAQGWLAPKNLGCEINSAGNEFSPSLVETGDKTLLFFSSDRQGNQDIYMSTQRPNGSWEPAAAVQDLNTSFDDARPNVSSDGLEIVFDSTRATGAPDIWTSWRPHIAARWYEPVKLGTEVNSIATESRASLSRDGKRLYFGSTRAGGQGSSDVHVATRTRRRTQSDYGNAPEEAPQSPSVVPE